MNYLIITICVLVVIIVYLLKRDCGGVVKIYPVCSNTIDKSTRGVCLGDCDNINDQCYASCNGDSDCIKHCYEQKAICYEKCLN